MRPTQAPAHGGDDANFVPPHRVRVVGVDDHPTLLLSLPHALAREFDLAGTYATIEDFLASEVVADVVLLDLDLTGTGQDHGLQGARGVAAVSAAGYRPLIYTSEKRPIVLARCVAAGSRGAIHKAQPIDDLKSAITTVAAGGFVLTTALAGLIETYQRLGLIAELTIRQCEVLSARARGEKNRAIAQRLGVSVRTIDDHIRVIGEKFADFLRNHSAADLERLLGLGEGDLLDWRQV